MGSGGVAKLCDAVLVQYMYCICGRMGGGGGMGQLKQSTL